MKHVYKYFIVAFIALLITTHSHAQQDAQFSQYMFNGLFYNPGYAGIEGVTRATVITRSQWTGYKTSDNYYSPGGKPPTSQAISLNTRLPLLKSMTGAGLHVVYDNQGPVTTYETQLSGAYHIKIGPGRLGIGLRAGVYAQRLQTDWYRVVDQSDPIYTTLVNNNPKQVKMDYATGLWYQTNKWYIGASINHLSRQKFSYGLSNDAINSILNNHMHITGGYTFQLSPSLKVTPTAMVQTDLRQTTFLIGPMVDYNSKFWIAVNARQSIGRRDVVSGGNRAWSFDDAILYAGVNLMKNNALRVGFAFDLVTNGRKAKAGTSHEIMLSYMLPAPGVGSKPKVRTPRYRHDEN